MADSLAPRQTTSEPKAGPWRTWLVLSDKRGDNGQVEEIAQALGWPCARKRLQMREPYVIGKPKVAATLHHIDLARSDPLEPPWPDLIITIGRRPSMVALWIREQSGGRTKIVRVGKPSGPLRHYDLVIAGVRGRPAGVAEREHRLCGRRADRRAHRERRVDWRCERAQHERNPQWGKARHGARENLQYDVAVDADRPAEAVLGRGSEDSAAKAARHERDRRDTERPGRCEGRSRGAGWASWVPLSWRPLLLGTTHPSTHPCPRVLAVHRSPPRCGRPPRECRRARAARWPWKAECPCS